MNILDRGRNFGGDKKTQAHNFHDFADGPVTDLADRGIC